MATIRQALPKSLHTWRLIEFPTDLQDGIDLALWKPLHPFFKARGYVFWISAQDSCMVLPEDVDIVSNGYAYAPITRGMGDGSAMQNLYEFLYPHPLLQAAQTPDGRSVVIRVLAIGEKGRETIELLQTISRGPYSLVTWNHAIPLLELIDFEDITFGVFPRVGSRLVEAYGIWAENSVGDIVDMIMQCLEALGFLHGLGIAHRDAFSDNFLVEWQPESPRVGLIPASRPRVYLNDFETAVHFPPDMPKEQRVCTGLPIGASFPGPERYRRPIPPEVEGDSLTTLSSWTSGNWSNVPPIDEFLASLRNPDVSMRPAAYEALGTIANIVGSIPRTLLEYPRKYYR
ncbi:hypothetical protein BD413DRAFT_615127 [Trametes elegans]|nr:hypothetical protein BD413DRAFT_615127 [Trametes elegans]